MDHPRRYQGEVVEWSDEKRCGFVRPRGNAATEPLVFLPLTGMVKGRRSPKNGDQVLYELKHVVPRPGKRLRTNLRADQVVFLGDELPLTGQEMGKGGTAIFGGLWLLLLLVGSIAIPLLRWAAIASIILSLVSLMDYARDKFAAGRHRWRVAESNLQIVALLGGWPGAALAQTLLRHKTRKREFQLGFRLVTLVNILATLAAAGYGYSTR